MTLMAAVLLTASAAQERPSRATLHEETLYQDRCLDVDTAAVLPRDQAGRMGADFEFVRRAGKLYLIPLGKARLKGLDHRTLADFPEELDLDNLSDAPIEVPGPMALVGRTSEGLAFKASLSTSWLFRSGATTVSLNTQRPFVTLEFAVQRGGGHSIPLGVRDLRATYSDSVARLDWSGKGDETYEVEWVLVGSRDIAGRRVVDRPSIEVPDLPAGRVYRFEVSRIVVKLGPGQPSAVSILTAPGGIEWRTLTLPQPKGHHYRINLREGVSDERDPDLIPFSWGVETPPGGGIQPLGKGEEAFGSTAPLPEFGYVRVYERCDVQDVFGVRLRDGRFAKVWVKGRDDIRDGLQLEWLLLNAGGRNLMAGPPGLKAEYNEGRIRLKWLAADGIAEYRVLRLTEARVEEVGRTIETGIEIKDAPVKEFLTYGVVAVRKDRMQSGPSRVEIHTFPSNLRVGTFELDATGQDSYSFAQSKTLPAKDGDLFITTNPGGASLRIRGSHGIRSGVDGGFGKIDASRRKALAEALQPGEIETHDRDPASLTFSVRSSDDGFAHVRIVGVDFPRVKFQYIYTVRRD